MEPGGKIKVVCHGCGARYLVRDTKVRGRRFRATCKKCGGIIVARCTNAFTVLPERGRGEGKLPQAVRLATDELSQDEEPSWYVVLGGKPYGPLKSGQVRQSHQTERVSGRTYLWRAGDPKWRRLSEIPEFEDLFIEDPTAFFRGELPEAEEVEAPLMAPASDYPGAAATEDYEEEETRMRTVGELAQVDDIYAGGVPYAGAASYDPPLPYVPPPVVLPRKAALPAPTGVPKRPETLALGSVQEAQDQTRPMDDEEKREGGLIRHGTAPGFHSQGPQALVSSPLVGGTLVEPPASAGPTLAGVPLLGAELPKPVNVFSDGLRPLGEPAIPPANLLLPLAPEVTRFLSTGKIAALAAIGGGLAVALTIVLVWSFAKPSPRRVVVAMPQVERAAEPEKGPTITVKQEKPSPSAATAGAGKGAPLAAAPEKPAAAEAAAPEKPVAAARAAPAEKRSAPRGKAEVKPREAPKHAAVKRSAPRRVEHVEPRAEKPRPSTASRARESVSADDILAMGSQSSRPQNKGAAPSPGRAAVDADDILASGASKAGKRPARATPKPAAGSTLPHQPSRGQIRAAIQRILPQVRSCHDKHGKSGVVVVVIRVNGNGKHESSVEGQFRGTPTGFCVMGAMERVRFPSFSGPSFSIKYPFQLQ